MYKEYREMSRVAAAEALYSDMAARHRARFGSIHVRAVWFLYPMPSGSSTDTTAADPSHRRDREDRDRPPTLH